jgi:hypothetical protein
MIHDGFDNICDGFKDTRDGFDNICDGFDNICDGFKNSRWKAKNIEKINFINKIMSFVYAFQLDDGIKTGKALGYKKNISNKYVKKNNIKISKEKLQLIVEKLFKTCKYENEKNCGKN